GERVRDVRRVVPPAMTQRRTEPTWSLRIVRPTCVEALHPHPVRNGGAGGRSVLWHQDDDLVSAVGEFPGSRQDRRVVGTVAGQHVDAHGSPQWVSRSMGPEISHGPRPHWEREGAFARPLSALTLG